MKTLFSIFAYDLKSIFKHFFVIVIIIAIGVLPALYAWVNIYANWDPYVNTGNIKVAVASRDPGIDLEDGVHVNVASEVQEDLKENDSIDWRFSKNADEAIEGVRSGKYYAAIVFEDNFTYNMYNIEDGLIDEDPAITYYSNTKKNAIAAKITDTAAENLLKTINTKYLETMFREVFEADDDVLAKLDSKGEDAVDLALDQLIETRNALQDFNEAIDLFSASSADAISSLETAGQHLDRARSKGSSDIAKAKRDYNKAKKAIENFTKSIDLKTTKVTKQIGDLDELLDQIKETDDEKTKKKLEAKAADLSGRILTILQDLRALIPDDSKSTGIQIVADVLDLMITDAEAIAKALNTSPESVESIMSAVKTASKSLDDLEGLNENDLVPGSKLMISDIKNILNQLKPLLNAADGVLDDIDPVLDAAEGTVSELDSSLLQLKAVLTSLENNIDDVIDKVNDADESEKKNVLMDYLGGDPEQYSKFFSSLVDVDVQEMYSIKTYGAAMTPFYSVLAIWVGCVMLVSLLQTNINRRKFPDATEAQAFFGRYIIFFLVGQVQAAVIVLGDIFLLHCEPVHPWLMWLAAAATSMVFSMFIYAVVLSFGDIGKAVVVVIMVLQIAGSSGSYPIELLPEIFSKIYLFFPFPYAINAIREALSGTYGIDYVIYICQLMSYFVIGILIGLLIRRPFIGVNHFVTEKLEDTEVL